MSSKQTDKPSIFSVFLKISSPLYDRIVESSVEMGQRFGSDFVVDDETHFPHLPLYLFAAPPRNKSEIIRTAKNFIKVVKPCIVRTVGLASSESGLVMINLEKSKELYQYHCQALDIFNPLREGQHREKYTDQDYLTSLSEKDRSYLDRYGHRWVLDNYTPHITIARINDLTRCKKAVEAYRWRFAGRTARTTALRIAEEFFTPANKSTLIFDAPLISS